MIRIDTVIEKARIYRNGAEIIRTGTAKLEKGSQTLQVFGMTSTSNTATARLFANGDLSCSNMHIVFPELGDNDNDNYQQIMEDIEMIDNKISAKELQLSLWKANGDFSSKNGQSAAEVQDYIEKLGDRIVNIESELRHLRKQKQALGKKRDEMRSSAICPVMTVDVTASEEGTYSFEFRYFENNSNWNPVYEVHSDAENPLEIKMKANIYQDTGEDWNDVQLSLFSGSPSEDEELPVLKPVYLDFRRAYAPAGVMYSASMSPKAAAAPKGSARSADFDDADYSFGSLLEDTVQPEPMVRMETSHAQIKEDDIMTEYALQGTRNVPKSNRGIMADLQSYEIPAEYRIAAVPSRDPNAYLTARISASDLPFNNAVKADIYLNGMYTGELYMDPDMTEEYADITLGRQGSVKISRKELARKTHTTMLKGNKVVEHTFETKAANLSDKEITLYLKGQIPVSQNKEIIVEPVELSGATLDAESGIVELVIKIAAGASETVKLGYKVTRPRNRDIEERTSYTGRRAARRSSGYCPYCGSVTNGIFCQSCGRKIDIF